jgi:hypothetical protein
MTRSIADFVVSIDLEGQITSQESVSEPPLKDVSAVIEMPNEQEIQHQIGAEEVPGVEKSKVDGKLIMVEETEVGNISWEACAYLLFEPNGFFC